MLGLNNDQLIKYTDKLIKKTEHSTEQVNNFFYVLSNRMNDLHIASLNDLLVRYESIDKYMSSERDALLKEVVGLFHLNNLKVLMNILEKEKHSLKMIKKINEKIQTEEELQKNIDVTSEEYRESLRREKELLERKQYHINCLIDE
jgi:flagellar biosynthesis component FlhA